LVEKKVERMLWLTWRRQRVAALIAAIGLGILAPALLITGLQVRASFQSLGVPTCVAHPELANCAEIVRAFTQPYKVLISPSAWFGYLLLPTLVALFVGAPLLAGEFEHDTHRLVWTQSLTRMRYLAATVGLVLLTCLLLSAILTALLTWWLGPFNQLYGRFDLPFFDFEGVAPLGYMAFAVALAIAAGALLRKTIPAMLVTVVGFLAIRYATYLWARPHYQPPLSATWDPFLRTGTAQPARGDWTLNVDWIDAAGHRVTQSQVLTTCGTTGAPYTLRPGSLFTQCTHAHGWFLWEAWQPADRFWRFQGIEAALFFALALACVAITFWAVRRQSA
jgi:hypothetical protein